MKKPLTLLGAKGIGPVMETSVAAKLRSQRPLLGPALWPSPCVFGREGHRKLPCLGGGLYGCAWASYGQVTRVRACPATAGLLLLGEMNRICLRRSRQRPSADTSSRITRSSTNRLETRTKESTECASVMVSETKRRAMKVRACE